MPPPVQVPVIDMGAPPAYVTIPEICQWQINTSSGSV
jgi:hypothetical protein